MSKLFNKRQNKIIPKILLVGCGRFGRHHLRVLKKLDKEGVIELTGVVVRDKAKRKVIEAEFGVTTYPEITRPLLISVDAVDIVTPPETHFEIVKRSLVYTNVFVEKPLATTEKDALYLEKKARKYKHILTVGHIYRHHPVAIALKKLMKEKSLGGKIEGSFINPIESDQGRNPSLELLHLFDVIDFLWPRVPEIVYGNSEGRICNIDIRYDKDDDAQLRLGWHGNDKKRTLIFKHDETIIEADFMENKIILKKGKTKRTYNHPIIKELLEIELQKFATDLTANYKSVSDREVGARIVSIAERSTPIERIRPKVAVLGGGIFGTSVATELGTFCDVTLFEKNEELLHEGSRINQFRHHFGYHYPRSDDTVYDVQRSRDDFEAVFKEAINHPAPTYYGLAKKGSYVSAKEFINFCKKHSLPYKKEFPQKNLLSREEVDLCVAVPEPNYHHSKLKSISLKILRSLPKVRVLCSTKVTMCSIKSNGKKIVSYISNTGLNKKGEYDYIVNATYANINILADWLNFEHCPIRVDRAEVLILRIPIPPISLTVIDGPFATLMPTGNKNEFTLYHVKESIIDRYVPKMGLIKSNPLNKSNSDAILRESIKFFPILKEAVIIESRLVNRGVQAYREHDDSRVADLISHGFGCWSILSGKILSSVTIAKRVATAIRDSSKI